MTTSALPQRLQSFYESFRRDGEQALDRLDAHFTADVHFCDPFRETSGIAPLRQLFVRMFRQYRVVDFRDFRIDGDASAFTLTYNMHLRMKVGPTFVTPMASVCRARADKIADLRDYYDFTSALISPFPAVGSVYRKVITKLFL